MSIEEQVHFVELDMTHLKGRVDALSSLCALLIATHPRANKVVEVLKARAVEIGALDQPTESLQSYADGFTRFAFDLSVEEVLEAFHRDELKLFQLPKFPGH